MLRPLLLICKKILRQRIVFRRRSTASAGARNRPDDDPGPSGVWPFCDALLTDEDFGRGTDDMAITKIVVIHIRGWIDRAQCPVQGERMLRERFFQTLCEHNLHRITRGDVFPGPGYRGQKILSREIPLDGTLGDRRIQRGDRCMAQPLPQCLQSTRGPGIRVRLARIGIDHEIDASRDVIHDCQLIDLQQQNLRHPHRIRFTAPGEAGLDMTNNVIAKVAGQAAAKSGQTRTQGSSIPGIPLAYKFERVANVGLHDLAIGDDFGAYATRARRIRNGADPGSGRESDEGIASKPLASDHRLQ